MAEPGSIKGRGIERITYSQSVMNGPSGVYSVNVRRNRTAEETARQIERIYRNYNGGNPFTALAGASSYSQQRLVRVAPNVWNALSLTGRDEGPGDGFIRNRLISRRRLNRR